jgi:hypothetical protein
MYKGRKKGQQNKAVIVREYLQSVFSDIATNDLTEIMQAMSDKAKDGSIQAARLITDNMGKIVDQDLKENQVDTGIEVIINRDGIVIRGGGQGEGGVQDSGSSSIHEQDQFPQSLAIPNITLGSHGVSVLNKPEMRELYKDYVGPLEKKDSLENLVPFETETLYTWKGEVMGIMDVCRMEGINHIRVKWLMKRYDLSLEQAVEEVIELTDHPDNEKYNE